MPETPDFDQIAREMTVGLIVLGAPPQHCDAFARDLEAQLRLIWNARGAADIAKVEAELYADGTSRAGFDKMLDRALRTLDR